MSASQHQLNRIQGFCGGAHGLVKFKKAHIGSPVVATETNSGIKLPPKAYVLDVFLDVLTADAGMTVDVGTDGTSNDPDGFLDGASLAGVALVRGSLRNGAVTKGALFREDEDGSGAWVPAPCVTAGGDNITYTTSASLDTAVFDIYVSYIEL